MADTPTPPARNRSIRSRLEDLNGAVRPNRPTSASDRSSVDSSVNSRFDPDNEAVFSTRQLEDASRRISGQRAGSMKLDRNLDPELDFTLDEAVGPDSQQDTARSNEMPEDASASIEMGRGHNKHVRYAAPQFQDHEDFTSEILAAVGEDTKHSFRGVADIHEDLARSPNLPSALSLRGAGDRRGHGQKYSTNDLFALDDKENNRPAMAKTADYGSRNGSQESEARRRAAADTHARPSDDDDNVSLLSDGRPATRDLTSRSTRFGRVRSGGAAAVSSSAAVKTNNAVSNGHHGYRSVPTVASHEAKPKETIASNTITTQHSYLLPDLPNLSELVSGVYQDGTPVFSRHAATGSRFGSLSRRPDPARQGRNHAAIESLPVPSEERAILVSLRLLQDKVAELEGERANNERVIGELEGQLSKLKGEKQERARRLRSDSALGMPDSGSEAGGASARDGNKIVTEYIKLQKNMKSLQDRLDLTVQKLSTAEISIRNLTRERDAALAQLGVAFCTSEELKQENDRLVKENEALTQELLRARADSQAEKLQWAKKEAALRKKLQKRDEAVNEVREMTREIRDLQKPKDEQPARVPGAGKHGLGLGVRPGNDAQDRTDKQTLHHETKERAHQAKDVLRSEDVPEMSASHARQNRSTHRHATRASEPGARLNDKAADGTVKNKSGEPEPKAPKRRTRKVVVEETIHSDLSDSDAISTGSIEITDRDRHEGAAEETMQSQVSGTGDFTKLSFLDDEVVAQLRKTLEAERIKQKETRAGVAEQEQKPLSRKSSMKLPGRGNTVDKHEAAAGADTGRFSIKEVGRTASGLKDIRASDEQPKSQEVDQDRARRRGSSRGGTRIRPRPQSDNMTSAFIIPDITIRYASAEEGECTHQGVHGSAPHDRRSCTICRRSTSWAKTDTVSKDDAATTTTTTNSKDAKDAIKIPKPIPVSERIPQPGPYDEEPTMRPSQPPGVALAIVMKGLEDELAHLKMMLAKHQAVYDGHDASLSKAKRKALCRKMAELLKSIDAKADQIYALYDVLEGQMAKGQSLTDDNIEMTLHSIGINMHDLPVVVAAAAGASGGGGGGVVAAAAVDDDATNDAKTKKADQAVHEPHTTRNHFSEPDFSDDDDEDDDDLPWDGIDETGLSAQSGGGGRYTHSRHLSLAA